MNLDQYLFAWNPQSTYIKPPRYVKDLISSDKLSSFHNLKFLAKYGDGVSSDHISPAGSIVRNSPAADYLASKGLVPRQFNSYGSRRGNWEVMQAGTFSHLRLRNLMAAKSGPYTVHQPSGSYSHKKFLWELTCKAMICPLMACFRREGFMKSLSTSET